MTGCEAVREALDEAVRRPLPAEVRGDVRRHADGCAACREALADADLLAPRVGALATEVAPPPFERLSRPLATRRRVPAAPAWLAAAALVLVALAVAARARRPADGPPRVADAAPPAATPVRDATYARATHELDAELATRVARLDPATRASIARNLAVIDRALAETEAALARDGGNVTLGALLDAIYRQKLALLRRATALAS